MDFNIGDRISFIDSTEKGEIFSITNSSTFRIKTEEGFLISANISQIIKIDDSIYSNYDFDITKIIYQKEGGKNIKKSKSNFDFSEIKEIDIHIENLLENTRNLTNYDIVQYQLRYAEKKVLEYLARGLRRFVIIHGKGSGVLRSEIISLFEKKHNFKAQDASFEKYGIGGATLIVL